MPKVTVLIPVYNRARYVSDAIDSILAQTFKDFELLVIDDGSTDGSREVVRAYRDPRIRLLCNDRNLGIPATRNRGVDAARGEYLAFLDSDDSALPQRLAQQVAFLDRHPDHAAVGTWLEWMDEAGRPLGKYKRKPGKHAAAAESLFRPALANGTAMARTAILRSYRYREQFRVREDHDIWMRIATGHKLATLPKVLISCRIHPDRTIRGNGGVAQPGPNRTLYLEIVAEQLRALGVPYTETDLERHIRLRDIFRSGFVPDRAYMDWARTWLLLLRSANRTVRRFPEPAFSRRLGRIWWQLCWASALSPRNRFWQWRYFHPFPLAVAASTDLWMNVLSWIRFNLRTANRSDRRP